MKYKLKDVCLQNKYPQLDAESIIELSCESKEVKLLPSSKNYDLFTSYEIAGDAVCNGEVITLGKARYANIKYWCGSFVSSNNNIIESKNKNILKGRYLYYFLLCTAKDYYIEATTYPKFDQKSFDNHSIYIPDVELQIKRLKILDSLTDLIEKECTKLKQLDELTKSRFIEMFGDPLANDKKFKTKPLSLACPFNKYKGTVDSVDDKYWILNLDMIESNTGRIIEKVYQSLNEIGNSTISFDKECVLYSKLRPYLNKVAIPDTTGYATSELISMKTGDEINKYYLAYLLRNESFVTYINSKTAGAKMPRASMDHLRDFPLMIPEIEMQNEFACFVEQIDKLKFTKKEQLLHCSF